MSFTCIRGFVVRHLHSFQRNLEKNIMAGSLFSTAAFYLQHNLSLFFVFLSLLQFPKYYDWGGRVRCRIRFPVINLNDVHDRYTVIELFNCPFPVLDINSYLFEPKVFKSSYYQFNKNQIAEFLIYTFFFKVRYVHRL